jgi:type II secretory pathway pseudopilin PulG
MSTVVPRTTPPTERRSLPGDAMSGPGSAERGFTYIGLLVAVTIMGLLLTVVSRVWSTTERREREAQLLWVGHEYRLAIASYYASGNRFPDTLQQLLQDERFPIPLRHLRRLYPDPMTGKADWTLILTADGQRIMGVASSSNTTPIKRTAFDLIDAAFEHTDCYCAWQFVYSPNRFNRSAVPGAALPPVGPGTLNPGFNPGHISPLQPGGGLLTPGTTPQNPGGPN